MITVVGNMGDRALPGEVALARKTLAEPEHLSHAAVIYHVTYPEADGAFSGPPPHFWVTVHRNATEAARELNRIEAGDGNYARDYLVRVEIGPAFDLLRNAVAK